MRISSDCDVELLIRHDVAANPRSPPPPPRGWRHRRAEARRPGRDGRRACCQAGVGVWISAPPLAGGREVRVERLSRACEAEDDRISSLPRQPGKSLSSRRPPRRRAVIAGRICRPGSTATTSPERPRHVASGASLPAAWNAIRRLRRKSAQVVMRLTHRTLPTPGTWGGSTHGLAGIGAGRSRSFYRRVQ